MAKNNTNDTSQYALDPSKYKNGGKQDDLLDLLGGGGGSSQTGLTPKKTSRNKNTKGQILGKGIGNTLSGIFTGATKSIDSIVDAGSDIGLSLTNLLTKNNDSVDAAALRWSAKKKQEEFDQSHILGEGVRSIEQKVDQNIAQLAEDNPDSKLAEYMTKSAEMGQSVGRMLPTMAVGGAVGALAGGASAAGTAAGMASNLAQASGLGAMWLSVYDSAIDQALAEGHDYEYASKVGFVDATLEVVTEMAFGGIAGTGGEDMGFVTKFIQKASNTPAVTALRQSLSDTAAGTLVAKAASTMGKIAKTHLGKGLFSEITIGSMAEEALEEMASEIFSPLLERAVTGDKTIETAKLNEVLEAGLGGALMSLYMAPIGKATNAIAQSRLNKEINSWTETSMVNRADIMNRYMKEGWSGLDEEADRVQTSYADYLELEDIKKMSAFDLEVQRKVGPIQVTENTTPEEFAAMEERFKKGLKLQSQINVERALAGEYKSASGALQARVEAEPPVASAKERLNQLLEEASRFKETAAQNGQQNAALSPELQQAINDAKMELQRATSQAYLNASEMIAEDYAAGRLKGEELRQYEAYLRWTQGEATEGETYAEGYYIGEDENGEWQVRNREDLSKEMFSGNAPSYDEMANSDLSDVANDVNEEFKSRISTRDAADRAANEALANEINDNISSKGINSYSVEVRDLGFGNPAEYMNGKIILNSRYVQTQGDADFFLGHETVHNIIDTLKKSGDTNALNEFKATVDAAMALSGNDKAAWTAAAYNNYVGRYTKEELNKYTAYNPSTGETVRLKPYADAGVDMETIWNVVKQNAKARFEGGEYKTINEDGTITTSTIEAEGEEEVYAKFISFLYSSTGFIDSISNSTPGLLSLLSGELNNSALKGVSNKYLADRVQALSEQIKNVVQNKIDAEQSLIDLTEEPDPKEEAEVQFKMNWLLNQPSKLDDRFFHFDPSLLPEESKDWDASEYGDYWEKTLPKVFYDTEGNRLSDEVSVLASRTHPYLRDAKNRIKVLYHGTPQSPFNEFKPYSNKGTFTSDELEIARGSYGGGIEYLPDMDKGYFVSSSKYNSGGYYKVYYFCSKPIVIDARGYSYSNVPVSTVIDEYTKGDITRPELSPELEPVRVKDLPKDIYSSLYRFYMSGYGKYGAQPVPLEQMLAEYDTWHNAKEEELVLANSSDFPMGYVVDVANADPNQLTQFLNKHPYRTARSYHVKWSKGGEKYDKLLVFVSNKQDLIDAIGTTLESKENRERWDDAIGYDTLKEVFTYHNTDKTIYGVTKSGAVHIDALYQAGMEVGCDGAIVMDTSDIGGSHQTQYIADYYLAKSIYDKNPDLDSRLIMSGMLPDSQVPKTKGAEVGKMYTSFPKAPSWSPTPKASSPKPFSPYTKSTTWHDLIGLTDYDPDTKTFTAWTLNAPLTEEELLQAFPASQKQALSYYLDALKKKATDPKGFSADAHTAEELLGDDFEYVPDIGKFVDNDGAKYSFEQVIKNLEYDGSVSAGEVYALAKMISDAEELFTGKPSLDDLLNDTSSLEDSLGSAPSFEEMFGTTTVPENYVKHKITDFDNFAELFDGPSPVPNDFQLLFGTTKYDPKTKKYYGQYIDGDLSKAEILKYYPVELKTAVSVYLSALYSEQTKYKPKTKSFDPSTIDEKYIYSKIFNGFIDADTGELYPFEKLAYKLADPKAALHLADVMAKAAAPKPSTAKVPKNWHKMISEVTFDQETGLFSSEEAGLEPMTKEEIIAAYPSYKQADVKYFLDAVQAEGTGDYVAFANLVQEVKNNLKQMYEYLPGEGFLEDKTGETYEYWELIEKLPHDPAVSYALAEMMEEAEDEEANWEPYVESDEYDANVGLSDDAPEDYYTSLKGVKYDTKTKKFTSGTLSMVDPKGFDAHFIAGLFPESQNSEVVGYLWTVQDLAEGLLYEGNYDPNTLAQYFMYDQKNDLFMSTITGALYSQSDLEHAVDEPGFSHALDKLKEKTLAGEAHGAEMWSGGKWDSFYNTEDAAFAKQYKELEEKYGTYGDTGIPKKLDANTGISEFTANLASIPNQPKKIQNAIRRLVLDATVNTAYTISTDKDALDAAYKWYKKFEHVGADGKLMPDITAAANEVIALSESGRAVDKRSVVRGQVVIRELMQHIAQQGEAASDAELDLFSKVCAAVAHDETMGAQVVQAATLLKKLTPSGRLYYVERAIADIQDELKNRKGVLSKAAQKATEKLKDIRSTEEYKAAVAEMANATTAKELDDAEQHLVDIVAKQIPPDIISRAVAWRYLSMLGNIRTHERNVLSNAASYIASGLTNIMSGIGQDLFVKKGEKTATLKRASQATKEFAQRDWELYGKDIYKSGGKMSSFQTKVEQARRNFGENPLGNLLEGAYKLNNEGFGKDNLLGGLEGEDTYFGKLNYRRAMEQYITANNIDVSIFSNPATKNTKTTLELLDKVRGYAMQQANRATYHEANLLANKLNELEKSSALGKLLVGGIAPFKRTPVNILKQGAMYSPIGIAKGIKELAIDVKNGDMSIGEAVNDLCQGMTGSMLMVLGFFLRGAGFLKAGGSDSDREEYYDEMLGNQKYSITIGDTNYTLDWLTPVSMPLFAGATIIDTIIATENGEEDDITFEDLLNVVGSTFDPLTNLSLLSGINSALSAYGDDNKIMQLGLSATESFASQFIPTAAGQLARAIDPVRRTTYASKDTTHPLGTRGEKFLRRLASKIPGLSDNNEPYVDMWGNEEVREGGFGKRLVDQMLVPWYSAKLDATEVDDRLAEVFAEAGTPTVLPATPNSYFTVNGKTLYLSPEAYTQVKKMVGRLSYIGVDDATKYNVFNNLDGDTKADIISDIYSMSRTYAKYQWAKSKGIKDLDAYKQVSKTDASKILKLQRALESGMSFGEYMTVKKLVGQKSKKAEKIQYLNSIGISSEWQSLFLD